MFRPSLTRLSSQSHPSRFLLPPSSLLNLTSKPRPLNSRTPVLISHTKRRPTPYFSIPKMPPERTNSSASASGSGKTNNTSLSGISLTFLGTASAQPSSTRNHSSLAVHFGGRTGLWLFDCGEATQQRLQRSTLKMGKIQKIFITHTHGDHIFGIAPLMAGCMNGAGGTVDGFVDPRENLPEDLDVLEIYGPLGTRAYIRSALRYTHTKLMGRYVVHELRLPHETREYRELPPHRFEEPGRNIYQTDGEGMTYGKGVWKDIFADNLISVSAAPIEHTVSCVGYVIEEAPVPMKMDPSQYVPHIKRNNAHMSLLSKIQRGEDVTLADGTVLEGLTKRTGRKIAILGDTCDPSPVSSLAAGADLLVHEATNAHLPGIDPMTREEDTYETVEARTSSRGHSTPQMAGRFAKSIGAKRLVLNHFSSRYRGDDDVNEEARTVMDAIRGLAQNEFGGEVQCARDFWTVNVPHSR